jgi:hypothetical protein
MGWSERSWRSLKVPHRQHRGAVGVTRKQPGVEFIPNSVQISYVSFTNNLLQAVSVSGCDSFHVKGHAK